MDPYKIKIGGVVADPYRIAIEYGLDPILGQALKKILRCGRKHKSAEEDAKEVITTMERWLEIQRERAAEATYAGLTQEQIAERNKQCASSASIAGLDLAYPKKDAPQTVSPRFVLEEASRRFPYPNPDYVNAEDDTVHVDLSKLSDDTLTAAGFMEDGIIREVLKQQSNAKIGPYTPEPPPPIAINPGWLGVKTNMEKLLDERDSETNWP